MNSSCLGRGQAFLLVVFVSMLVAGCAARHLSPIEQLSLPADLKRVEFYQQSVLVPSSLEVFGIEKLFVMARYQLNGRGQRVRLAIRRYPQGDLAIQVLPTTSLMILETLHISDGIVTSKKAGEEGGESDFKRLFYTLLGDVISPDELFTLLLGRVPASKRFETAWNSGTWLTDPSLEHIGIRGPIVDLLISERTGLLSDVLIRDVFREIPILQIQYAGTQSSSDQHYPETVTVRSLKRDFEIELRLIKIG